MTEDDIHVEVLSGPIFESAGSSSRAPSSLATSGSRAQSPTYQEILPFLDPQYAQEEIAAMIMGGMHLYSLDPHRFWPDDDDDDPGIFVNDLLTMTASPTDPEAICEICLERDPEQPLCIISACRSGHKFCIECLKTFFSMKLSEGLVHSLSCPGVGCRARPNHVELHRFLDEEGFNRYNTLLELLKNPKARQCPRCQELSVFHGSKKKPTIKCLKCQLEYCFYHGDAHIDSSCKDYNQRNAPNEKHCRQWETVNTRQCKRCKARVEKSSGCNHITCRCGHQFCYLCGRQYSMAHFKWWNPIGCPGMQRSSHGMIGQWACRAGIVVGLPVATAAAVALVAVSLPVAAVAVPVVLAKKRLSKKKS